MDLRRCPLCRHTQWYVGGEHLDRHRRVLGIRETPTWRQLTLDERVTVLLQVAAGARPPAEHEERDDRI